MAKVREAASMIGVAVAVTLGTVAASAQTSHLSLYLAKGSPEEDFSGKEVEVGGRTIVGIGTSVKPGEPKEFSVWAPTASVAGQLCLNVTSQSGAYIAFADYTRDADDSIGSRRLPYSSQYLGYLKDLEVSELALLIEASKCDDLVQGPYLVGAWGSVIEKRPQAIEVMINSRGSDYVAVEVTAKGERSGPGDSKCNPVPAGQRQGFDIICKIKLLDNHDRQTITVNTVGFGGILNPPVQAEILLPK